jgi:hypothetical protein
MEAKLAKRKLRRVMGNILTEETAGDQGTIGY